MGHSCDDCGERTRHRIVAGVARRGRSVSPPGSCSGGAAAGGAAGSVRRRQGRGGTCQAIGAIQRIEGSRYRRRGARNGPQGEGGEIEATPGVDPRQTPARRPSAAWSCASIRSRNRAWRADWPSGEIRQRSSDNAPEAASRSRPIAPDRAASALVVTSCEQPARAAGEGSHPTQASTRPATSQPGVRRAGVRLHADHERGSRRAHSSDRTWAGGRLVFR